MSEINTAAATSTSTAATMERPTATAKKRPAKSKPATPTAKSTADKAAAKANPKPAAGTKPATTGKPTVARKMHESKHSDLPQQEVVWNERRTAIVKAMRKLKATSQTTAVTAGEIVKAAGLKDDTKPAVFRVRIVLDVYRTNEIVHNGYAQSLRLEGERELRYYLTQRGVKVNLEKGKE